MHSLRLNLFGRHSQDSAKGSKNSQRQQSKVENRWIYTIMKCSFRCCIQSDYKTRAQQLLRWATVPEQSGPKSGGEVVVSLSVGELGHHLTQCRMGRGLAPYQVVSWSIQPFGHNRDGPRGGCCAPIFFGEGAESSSNTMWPRPRPTSIQSGILIHPTVWPQYTNATDRTDRADNGSIAPQKSRN